MPSSNTPVPSLNLKLSRLFQKDGHRPIWSLHTTMSLEPDFAAVLLALQVSRGKPPAQGDELVRLCARHLKGTPELLIVRDPLTPLVMNSRPLLPMTDLQKLFVPPTDKLGTNAAAVHSQTDPLLHAKLSLVAFQKQGTQEISYRLGIYSKNTTCASPHTLETGMFFDLLLSDQTAEEQQNGRQFTGFLERLSDISGKICGWLKHHGLNREGSLYRALKSGFMLVPLDNPGQDLHPTLFFGGLPSKTTSLAQDMRWFDGKGQDTHTIDRSESVILTPPAFVADSVKKALFKKAYTLWDCAPPLASHSKLYLLKRLDPEGYELWLGSANCSTHGLGLLQEPEQNTECLVRLTLTQDEFRDLKTQLSAWYQPFNWTGPGSLTPPVRDKLGTFLAQNAHVSIVRFVDTDGTTIRHQDLYQGRPLSKIVYTLTLRAGVSLKNCPVPPVSNVLLRPVEQADSVLAPIISVQSSPTGGNERFTLTYAPGKLKFRPCQRCLSVGSGNALVWFYETIGKDIPVPDDPDHPTTVEHFSNVLALVDQPAGITEYCAAQKDRLDSDKTLSIWSQEQRCLMDQERRVVEALEKLSPRFAPSQTGAAVLLPVSRDQLSEASADSTAAPARAAGQAPALTDYQAEAAAALEQILVYHSRAFLADEAGLGKTYVASQVLLRRAQAQWARQGSSPKPFFALYICPNQALIQENCKKMADFLVPKLAGLQAGFYNLADWGLDRLILAKGAIERIQGKYLVLLPCSIDLLGQRDKSQEQEDRILEELREKSQELKGLELDEVRIRTEAHLLSRQFGLVLLDEYHRYFSQLPDHAKGIYQAEAAAIDQNGINEKCQAWNQMVTHPDEASKAAMLQALDGLRLLFISATPYATYRSDEEKLEPNASYLDPAGQADQALLALPSFGEFAPLFCGGWQFEPRDTAVTAAGGRVPNLRMAPKPLIDAENAYKTQKTPEAAKALNHLLARRMVRNERSRLSGSQEPERHVTLLGGATPEELLDGQGRLTLEKPFLGEARALLDLKQACKRTADSQALSWARNIPWLLTFSTPCREAVQLKKRKEQSGYFSILSPEKYDEEKTESLFLYEMFGQSLFIKDDQIRTLPEQNLAMDHICRSNLEPEMAQLIWMPPTRPFYQIPQDSLYHKYRDHSKLIIFGEYLYLQRGGALLTSEYARACNRLPSEHWEHVRFSLAFQAEAAGADVLPELPQAVCWEAQAGWDIRDRIGWCARLAAPAFCARRLGLAPGAVEDAFCRYFNRPDIRDALCRYITQNEKRLRLPSDRDEAYWTLGLLCYCVEGNLLSVLNEWLFTAGEKDPVLALKRILDRKSSLVHVQTAQTFHNAQDGLPRSCGYGERLTYDKGDVSSGTSNNTEDDSPYAITRKAFNSPFYPMLLFVGRGAQEGLDFHLYCHRIMHLTLPRNAVSFDQRQGRIDRRNSLLVRKRAWELLQTLHASQPPVPIPQPAPQCWQQTFQILLDVQSTLPSCLRKDQLFPYWQIKPEDALYQSQYQFQRIIPAALFGHRLEQFKRMCTQLESYRRSFGYGRDGADIDLSPTYGRDKFPLLP